MFHSAALRLTVWYLAIIMAISIIFSVMIFKVSSADLYRNANRQIGYFTNFLGPLDNTNYAQLRQNQYDEDRGHLRDSLVVFNLLVLVGGGLASYWLARRTLEPIEAALEAQTRFAADASHELRTPLAAIQAENEVALRNPNLKKDEAVELLRSNLEEVGKLNALSEGLLRLASGSGQAIEFVAVSISEIIGPAIERNSKAAAQKRIKIINKSRGDNVRGEPSSLSEVISIFIDNAIKYSPPGSRIVVSSGKWHKDIRIKVADQGQGIKASDLPNIFERFYRTDDSRNKQGAGGYGLGLAIAKKIALAHGGHIDVQTTLNKGSAFTLNLPAA